VQDEIDNHPTLNHYLDYFHDNYVGPTARFQPSLWSVFDRMMENRTNNASENFNSRWAKSLNHHQPNFWPFVHSLKSEETRFRLEKAEAESQDPADVPSGGTLRTTSRG
jgi:hypothetical protein